MHSVFDTDFGSFGLYMVMRYCRPRDETPKVE